MQMQLFITAQARDTLENMNVTVKYRRCEIVEVSWVKRAYGQRQKQLHMRRLIFAASLAPCTAAWGEVKPRSAYS